MEYFPSNKQTKDGLGSWCRNCSRECIKNWKNENPNYYKKYYEVNLESFKKNAKKWKEKNKKKLREYRKQWDKIYYKKNKDKISEHNKKKYEENKDKLKKRSKKYYKENKDRLKERILERHKKWLIENPEYMKEYQKERKKNDPQFRLKCYFSTSIWYALKKKGSSKKGYSWEKIVGYTTKELMVHLENQFTEGMTWDTYGKWHIDHIIPQSAFHFTSYEDDEFQECWALNNLQPLWSQDNLIKSNKIKI